MGCRSRFSCLIGAIRQTGQGRAWSDGSCSSHGHGKLWAGKSRWTARTGRPCAHGTCFACSSVSSDDCAHVRVRAFCIASRCARPCRLRSRTGRSRLHWTTARLRSAHWATARLRSAAWTTARSSALCAFCTELRLQVVRALANAVVLVHVVCVLLEVVVRASVRYLR